MLHTGFVAKRLDMIEMSPRKFFSTSARMISNIMLAFDCRVIPSERNQNSRNWLLSSLRCLNRSVW